MWSNALYRELGSRKRRIPQRPEHSQTEQDNLFGHEAVHEQLI